MSWLSLQTLAQISIERILNALPEGILITFFAWILLRVLRKQSSGTRFAVWFLVLMAIAALPVVGGLSGGRAVAVAGMAHGAWGSMRPAINIPAHWAVVIFSIWLLGACLATVRLAFGFWRLRALRQSCSSIELADLDAMVRKTVETITTSGRVAIATSDAVRVPAAIGFWKRTIVLPVWALRELPAADLNAVLLHEFAHLRRGDDWTNLIQKIVGALFFFHPAVWWIDHRLSAEREMACDDAVLAETANPRGYATCLVSLLEKSVAQRRAQKNFADKQWSMAQAAIDRAREASLRLARILDSNRPSATRVWKPALGMVGAFSLICLVAIPVAPRVVGFDAGMALKNSAQASLAAVSSASLPKVIPDSLRTGGDGSARAAVVTREIVAPAVVPAGLRTDGTLAAGRRSRISREKLTNRSVVPTEALAVATRPSRERVIAVNADANEGGVSEFQLGPHVQTLVFFETTQYRMSDSMVWSIQVWHVMLVTAGNERSAKVPTVNSI